MLRAWGIGQLKDLNGIMVRWIGKQDWKEQANSFIKCNIQFRGGKPQPKIRYVARNFFKLEQSPHKIVVNVVALKTLWKKDTVNLKDMPFVRACIQSMNNFKKAFCNILCKGEVAVE